jgi:hypothetical protein
MPSSEVREGSADLRGLEAFFIGLELSSGNAGRVPDLNRNGPGGNFEAARSA